MQWFGYLETASKCLWSVSIKILLWLSGSVKSQKITSPSYD